jgi:hypothetical protein
VGPLRVEQEVVKITAPVERAIAIK